MRYRKRPVEVEAIQFTGENVGEILRFTGTERAEPVFSPAHRAGFSSPHIRITTLEGVMEAHKGDWIIRGVEGEVYPCQDSIFRATYDECAESSK